MEFEGLPEGCIASILSRTTPADVCRFCIVSKTFYSAAESDAVWETFLPSDIHSIISQSPSPLHFSSKKALFLALSHRPILIDQGKKTFQLDTKTGNKCYMLSARALTVVWADTPHYWNWTTHPHSRFPEVAELRDVCWLEIRGVLNCLALSPNTQYAAYLVFKLIDARGFENRPVELSVNIFGGKGSTKNVCLCPNVEGLRASRVQGLPTPNVRSDGWWEIEMGEFFNAGLEDEVQMSVMEIKGGNWKRGLFVEGIEVRPQEQN